MRTEHLFDFECIYTDMTDDQKLQTNFTDIPLGLIFLFLFLQAEKPPNAFRTLIC